MIFLPRCAASLARLAADETSRFSMAAVRVFELADARFRLEATDGRVLGILRGPSCPAILDERAAQALPEPESLALEALIPAPQWKDAFKNLPRTGRNEIERTLGLLLSQTGTIAMAGDTTRRLDVLDGRYPDVNAVLPGKGAIISFRVNPFYLANLLEVAGAIAIAGGCDPEVGIHYFGRGQPIGITAHSGQKELFFDGLIMPLVPESPARPSR